MRLVSKSTYLRDHELLPVTLAAIFVLIGGGFALYARDASAQNSAALWIGVVLLFLFLFAFLISQRRFRISGERFSRGRFGEQQVLKELELLDSRFTVFHNLRIGRRADNDFVVVGPTGIFAIEVKRYFRITERDFSKFIYQTKKEALGLSVFLRQALGKKIWVTPVLVLVDLRNYVPLGEKNGVHVLTPNALLRIATSASGSTNLDQALLNEISALLIKA